MRKVVFVLALFVALAATTGCIGGSVEGIDADITPDAEPIETNETGNEILASTLNSTDAVDSYRVGSGHRFVAGASGLFNINLSMESGGEFDRNSREARVDSNGNVDFSAFGFLENETDFETYAYSDGETTYTRTVENDEGSGWSESSGNFSFTESVLGVESIVELSREAEAELLGGETVNGFETYVVSLDTPPERLSRHSSAVIALHGAGIEQREGEMDQPEEGEAEIDELETYLWIDRDTRRPVRLAYFMSLGGPGSDEEGGNTTEGGTGGDDGGGSVGQGGVEFLFEANYDYGEAEVDAPEGV